ncbi:MAG: M13 family metallopeptidase [Myxococcales bacterium]|nr:M13 family metallopeptidase [Myxococcales bacterium]
MGVRVGALLCAALALAACPPPPVALPPEEEPPPALPETWQRAADEVRAVLDANADPCVDFYAYACGGWLSSHTLPDDRSTYGRGFGELIDRNHAIIREILEDATATGDDLLLRYFYRTCIDEVTIDARGAEPLAPFIGWIDEIRGHGDFFNVLGILHASAWGGAGPLFAFRIEPDPKNPTTYILTFDQGGLGLPDRDYYVADGPRGAARLAYYEEHVATMLTFLGEDEARARKDAAAIVELERELAAVTRPRAAMREPAAIYNRVGVDGLRKLTRRLPWAKYFAAADLGPIGDNLNLTNPEFFAALDGILKKRSARVLRAYLRWHLIHANAEHLSAPIAAEHHRLEALLTGIKALPPRWERCVTLANEGGLGERVGPEFVRRTFAGASQTEAEELTRAIEAAFAERLAALPWMDPTTRARAEEKVRRLVNKIGHPDRWRDYSTLELHDSFHLENVFALRAFESLRHAGEIGGAVDKEEWELAPGVVNAYYSPPFNQMVFLAGILQPPYFDADWPAAMNFGGIGMVIGHELTHGFDDEGRHFDADGVLREWWEPQAQAQFAARAQCIERTYSAIEALPGLPINGRLTLGENIADFGGIRLAYDAYQRRVRERGDEPQLLADLSNEQLFFVAFAQGWCSLASPEITRLLTTVDPHALPEFRVNVPLRHAPGFWQAFACEPGAPMRAAEVCEIW